MHKLLYSLLLSALMSAQVAVGQTTEELLGAKRVRHFVVLKADLRDKSLGYFLDDDKESRNIKNAHGKVCFAVEEKGPLKQLRIESAYLNPFRYQIAFGDTTASEPTYIHVNKFLEAVVGLSNQLTMGGANAGIEGFTAPKAATEAIAFDTGKSIRIALKVKASSVDATLSSENKRHIIKINSAKNTFTYLLEQVDAPSLIGWVYHVQTAPADIAWLPEAISPDSTPATIIKKLREKSADTTHTRAVLIKLAQCSRQYYQPDTAKYTLLEAVKGALDEVAGANSFEALKVSHAKFKAAITRMQAFNKKSADALKAFMEEQKRDLPGERTNKTAASSALVNYSRQSFSDFENRANDIQATREQLVATLVALDGELDNITAELSGSSSSYRLATLFLTEEKLREFTVTVHSRTIAMTVTGGIAVSVGEVLIKNEMRLRASKKLIPEFGTGLFYTNIEYPRYGTRVANGETFVEAAAATKYRAVVAAHLNLVFNEWDGLIHPLLQVGVGTGKDTPCMLLGGGLRFTQPRRLAISGGAIWTWRRQLDSLSVGDKIAGTAQLEDDLKLTLRAAPSLYLGIQLNF